MIFLIFDTAINEQYTLIQLQKQYPIHASLFHGTKDEALFDIAPYIFQIDSALYEKMNMPLIRLDELVYVETNEDLPNTIEHFQQFIYRLINNKEYYFRFWDARVLEKYLNQCDELHLQQFFGPIKAFFIDDNQSKNFKKFELGIKNRLMNVELQRHLFFDTLPSSKTEVTTDENTPKKRRFFVE